MVLAGIPFRVVSGLGVRLGSIDRKQVVARVAFGGTRSAIREGADRVTSRADARFLQLVLEGVRQQVLPVLKARTPIRTGLTSQSYSAELAGGNSIAILNANPFAPTINWNSGTSGRLNIVTLIEQTMNSRLPLIIRSAQTEAYGSVQP